MGITRVQYLIIIMQLVIHSYAKPNLYYNFIIQYINIMIDKLKIKSEITDYN